MSGAPPSVKALVADRGVAAGQEILQPAYAEGGCSRGGLLVPRVENAAPVVETLRSNGSTEPDGLNGKMTACQAATVVVVAA